MRKTVFFIFGVLLAIVVMYWLDGYYLQASAKRGSFFNYVQQDVGGKWRNVKTNIEALPELVKSIGQGQEGIYTALVGQTQKALESYYILEGQYPKSLNQIMDVSRLPKSLRLEYEQRGAGYTLRLIGENGEVIKEVLHDS